MLQIRHLRLRSFTSQSAFGCDLRFDKPVNIVRAGNTSGKSTCLQAVVYALGMERSFSTRTGIPMTFAMQERIQSIKDGPYETVLQSFVELEIQNAPGDILTIRRDIKGGTQTKLVQTWPTGRLTEPGAPNADQRDFFLHDAGAAQNEAGFHAYLAKFIGFDLPRVPRYDGGESPLYLEALFPMFFVEQKRGWSALQGPFPTHLQIQDLPRRVMEFILDLDVGKVRRELAEVRAQLREALSRWAARRDDLLGSLRQGSRLSGIPAKPTAEFLHNPHVVIYYFLDDEWLPIGSALSRLKARQSAIQLPPPTIRAEATEVEAELLKLRLRLDEISLRQEALRDRERAGRQQHAALASRLADLQTDLARNKDALKLKNLGSIIGHAASDHHCPTCHQSVESELMPLLSGATMGLEENIEFIKSQIVLYEASSAAIERELTDLQSLGGALQQESVETRSRIRALRQALIQPSDTPSIAALEAALSAQSKKAEINATQERVDEVLNDLVLIAGEYARLESRSKELARSGLSAEDRRKIDLLISTMQRQLTLYGYKSFLPNEITLAEDNFRPIAEVQDEDEKLQREIGLNDSASDGTRLKWAYYLSMLFLATTTAINHLQLNIFDEPGQQEIEWESLQAFLRWIAGNVKAGQQVIITTSEKKQRIYDAVANLDVKILNFDGFILQRI